MRKGWTQKRIAQHLGIPEPRLSRWSHGVGTRLCDEALRIKALDEAVLASGRMRPRRKPSAA